MAQIKEFSSLSEHMANYRAALSEPGINLAKIAFWYGFLVLFMVGAPITAFGGLTSGLLAGTACAIALFGFTEHLRLRVLFLRELEDS